jgi:hypothetical protein
VYVKVCGLRSSSTGGERSDGCPAYTANVDEKDVHGKRTTRKKKKR